MNFGLPDPTIEKICGVFADYPQVEKAVLYGSRAKGNYKNGSDIDLTLHGSADLTRRVLYRIMDDLDDLLLPYTIDLSIFSDISDADVVEHIQRVGVTFYEKLVKQQTACSSGSSEDDRAIQKAKGQNHDTGQCNKGLYLPPRLHLR